MLVTVSSILHVLCPPPTKVGPISPRAQMRCVPENAQVLERQDWPQTSRLEPGLSHFIATTHALTLIPSGHLGSQSMAFMGPSSSPSQPPPHGQHSAGLSC